MSGKAERTALECAKDEESCRLYLIEKMETRRSIADVKGDYIEVSEGVPLYDTEEPEMWWCEKHGEIPLGDEGIEYVL